jgi:Cu/Ag efflux protein CusF
MKTRAAAVVLCVVALGAWGARPVEAGSAAAPAPAAPGAKPSKVEARTVTLHGTVEAVDKEKGTVTLKGPKGKTMTLAVQDPQKLDAVKAGDPVVARYYESLAIQVRKPGQATPGASAQEAVATSKPGENPGAAVGRQMTVTATITAIDAKAQTVTIKGPQGNSETVKVRDPKKLAGVKVGDLVEFTYTQALAIALDKAPAKAK